MSIEDGLKHLRERWPEAHGQPGCKPIFLLAAGWRSGSTLLQRLIMSSGQVLMWGEPYGIAGMIQSLAGPFRSFTASWPAPRCFQENPDPTVLANQWVADFYPEIFALAAAHRAFVTALYETPALSKGIKRWGIKEVRLSMDHAFYLQWLFPDAKFVFLVRNPYSAYRSYRAFMERGEVWHNLWFDPIATPERFGQHWAALANSYRQGFQNVHGCFLKYEDLVANPDVVTKLEEYLELSIDRRVFDTRLGSPHAVTQEIPVREISRLSDKVASVAGNLGYAEPPSTVIP